MQAPPPAVVPAIEQPVEPAAETAVAVEVPAPPAPPEMPQHPAESIAIPTAAASVAPVPVEPRVPPLPPVTLELPPDSDLVLVETTHPAESALDEEPEIPAGQRRARRQRAQIIEEPLQMVETRKDSPPFAG